MMTFKCSTTCPHCIVKAGPHRKEEVSIENGSRWITEAASYANGHIRGLALTGGEPFYRLDLLRELSSLGNNLGMVVSVVSNGFWATSIQVALDILSSVPAIKMISFSTDVYHQKTISFENISNGIEAAKEQGIPYSVAVCTDQVCNPAFESTLSRLKALTEEDNIRISITFPVGRAEKMLSSFQYETVATPPRARCTMGSSPVIFPDGKVAACIGPILTLKNENPLILGNLFDDSLETILNRAQTNLVLHAIRTWGPWKLAEMIEKKGGADLLPDRYIGDCVCDTCYRLMSNDRIVALLEEISGEMVFKEQVAYGRAYFLKENTTAERLILEGVLVPEN